MHRRPLRPRLSRGPLPLTVVAFAGTALLAVAGGCRSHATVAQGDAPAVTAKSDATATTPPTTAPDQTAARAETIARIHPGLVRAGDPLPELTFESLDGAPVALTSLRGRPTVLVFGSCTCEPFVRSMAAVETLAREHGDRAAFLLVYIDEAHPTDGWVTPNNAFEVQRARSLDDRRAAARAFRDRLGVTLPIALETMDRSAERVFGAFPNRLVIVDAAGRIVSTSPPGPWSTRDGARTAEATLRPLLDASAKR